MVCYMKPDHERLKVSEAIGASLIIIGAAASIAVGFTLIAGCKAVAGLNPFRRRR